MENLKDTDIMPFGLHKGKEMQNVPKGYLLWLYGDIRKNKQTIRRQEVAVFAYIFDNLEAIKKEKDSYVPRSKSNKGMIVETKNGLKGKVYSNEALVNGKTQVRLDGGGGMLCDPLSLTVKGFFN